MIKYLKIVGVVIGLVGLTALAFAGDFDGSRPLSGTIGKVIEINPYKIADDVDPETVGLPKQFMIDFEAKVLRPSNDSLVRRMTAFKGATFVENMIVLQGTDEGVEGVDDGMAWSLIISQKDGSAVLSASGNGVAYVVFGRCAPMRDTP